MNVEIGQYNDYPNSLKLINAAKQVTFMFFLNLHHVVFIFQVLLISETNVFKTSRQKLFLKQEFKG